LPPQAGAWFSNSPLQASSTRNGELLHVGTAGSTGVVAAVHAAASYHASRVCDRISHVCGRDSHACGRAMQAEKEAGCAESNESVASASASAAIIEEK
jgi:hypothetical protein